jgi:hypothetical protein
MTLTTTCVKFGAPFSEQRNQEPSRPECENPGRDERNWKQQTELSEGRCCDPHSMRAAREADCQHIRKL